ncbi:GNAT family N-acetyltransferase [Blastococcus sp. TF02A_35]|uniref:GNAT family N-acetyltransferase n=1 Tax=Blastococcus sp. TF02A-35 TaxID=2559612 RepID=UPI001073A4BB|nr:GNAT family N-acetyltransferase [Blastococcus sp. TF02A_35]TFV53696.1 GNAT family N-acetyltransferase [Blastococcus sp. TF02A_35]
MTAVQDWQTEVVSDADAFDALAEEWALLHAASPHATPFQSHAWLRSWWRGYGRPGALRVVLVRSGGRLRAAAPLHLVRRAGIGVLAPVGAGISDVSDVLVADGDPEAAAQLVQGLLGLRGWQALDLPEVRPGTGAPLLAAAWPGPVRTTAASVMLQVPGRPVDELLGALKSSSAKAVRKKLRKADELGLTCRQLTAGEADDAVRRLLDLHARQWAGRGMTAEHGRDRFGQHLADAVPAMVASGHAALLEYALDGEHVASQLHLVGTEFVGSYLAGISPEARAQFDVAVVMMRHDLELTTALERPVLTMFRGEESYKLRWHPEPVANTRRLLVRPRSAGGAAVAGAVLARAGAVRWAKQRAPWVREVRDRARRLTRR